jgi:hypothetical protein
MVWRASVLTVKRFAVLLHLSKFTYLYLPYLYRKVVVSLGGALDLSTSNLSVSFSNSHNPLLTQSNGMAPHKTDMAASNHRADTTERIGAGVSKRRYKKVRFLENGLLNVERKTGKFFKV